MNISEEKLTYGKREDLPSSDFVFPKQRKYPIHNAAHARNALARVSQNGSPEEKAKVRAAVKRKYPDIDVEESAERHDARNFLDGAFIL